MAASVTKRNGDSVTVSVTVRLNGPMLESEEAIQAALNEAGMLLERENLERFDTDGSPIQLGPVRLTSKGRSPEVYETPYGPVQVERHVYQTAQGGKTYCPLEHDARLILNATPRWAKVVSYKYAGLGADSVVDDLWECNGRSISNRYCKMLGDAVGTFATAKEEAWNYELPPFDRPVASAAVGVDGTCMLLLEDGWREAMTGTIALYDSEGERLHTIYVGATPQYGKEAFHARLVRELDRVKARYPDVPYVGLGDGAADNWSFLSPLTDRQVVDFYHASEYVGKAAAAMFPGKRRAEKRAAWLDDRLHRLKHKQGAASRLLDEMEEFEVSHTVRGERLRCGLQSAITYFRNQKRRMHYSYHTARGQPIGSGVTEAACKVLIKQRFCRSGSRWKERGASAVLSIRSLKLTPGRWNAFWKRVSQYGFAYQSA
ncbi:MAG: ISKra4 family transposase [bacterium]